MSTGQGEGAQTGPDQPKGAATPQSPAATPPTGKTVPSTRLSAAWTTVAVGVVFLIALLIFIFQNLDNVRVTFLFFHGSFPLALSLLCAAIAGALVVLALGVARMMQLRRVARHHKDAAVAASRTSSG